MAILKRTEVNGDLIVKQNLNVNKNLTVDGNLNVQGDLTYVGVKDLRVKDKQIELNTDDSGSSVVGTADKAGIVIRGARKSGDDVVNDASILYDNSDDTLVVNKTIKGTVSKVAKKLTVTVTNESGSVNTVEFDGSEAKTVNVNLQGLQNQINSLTGGGADSIATQISNAIKELDAPDAAVDGQYVSSVSEADGKITVTRADLPVYDAEGAAAKALEDAKEYANGLNTAMDTRVDALEGNVAKWNGKQDALSETQLNAVNSGITSTKVSEYDTHVADTTKHITANERKAWNAKQNALSTDQLNAVNSGITEARVNSYEAHVADKGIHVTPEDKAKWNAADAEIKKLGTAAYENVLTGTIADSTSDDLVTAAQVKEYADTQDAATLASAKAYTDTTAASAAAKAVADVVAGAPSDFDTLKEVADWIESDKTNAAALQTNVSQLQTKVSTLESASHTHANRAELDKIKDGDKAKWDGHEANADIHVTAEQKAAWTAKQNALTNADVLATITSDQVSNWKDAASKAHVHANKTILDNITAEKVAAWDGAVSAAGVSSVGGKTGALSLKGGSEVLGDVNLSISDTGEISAAIVSNSFDSFGSAATALNDAKTYTDEAKSAVIGNDNDDKSVNTIKGAKAYADAAAAAVKSEVIGVNGDAANKDTIFGAKAYADEKVKALSDSVAATDAEQDTKIANIENGTTLDGRYVNVSGDTMTGDLTMPSSGNKGIIFGDMKIVWNDTDKAIEFVSTTPTTA